MHPGFQGTRELKLIESLLEAYEETDADKFSDCVSANCSMKGAIIRVMHCTCGCFPQFAYLTMFSVMC